MRIKVQAADEQEYQELKYRLFDIWDESAYAEPNDEARYVVIINPPTALLRELTDDYGYNVTELQPAGVA